MDPISATAIGEAAKRLESGGIGRSTKEYVMTSKGMIVYEDTFEVKLWEIAVAAGIGALIYYLPDLIRAYNPEAIVRDFFEDVLTSDVPSTTEARTLTEFAQIGAERLQQRALLALPP